MALTVTKPSFTQSLRRLALVTTGIALPMAMGLVGATAQAAPGPNELYISVAREGSLYGSLMKASLEIDGQTFTIKPQDMTTHLVIVLPTDLVNKKSLAEGNQLEGTILSKDYQPLKVPTDVINALNDAGMKIDLLSLPQQRQGIFFINEAKTSEIRTQRIETLVMACKKIQDAQKKQTREPI
jgi:hypothetical protein